MQVMKTLQEDLAVARLPNQGRLRWQHIPVLEAAKITFLKDRCFCVTPFN